ncbi:MAG: arsenite methyltransferase [Bacteroidales bacterium]|nr:arsenite methyltransferase [Bacteroidales bacterium]MCF8343857.1 arsenite methyltransferase [Bacteroidales bacterium]MCF8349581.1 arsenite methyltransferase [Bacteroidales bacterium]MCF8375140.1 arsenite methyltransferase [Bacteroidales bacterium]MCF8400047.1 arsenite methyltransferase [Bacteroidales bacterium]
MNKNNLKTVVKEKYSQIAQQSKKQQNETSCCGTSDCCSSVDYAIFSEDYTRNEGYNSAADLGLGCGLPTEFAGIEKGDHVLDLGSGAGNDCFVVRAIVGESGKVTGLDFTDEMVEKAIDNNKRPGYPNIEFVKGDIEDIPLKGDSYDVIISNCVLNLVPDKEKAFSEIFRVLKKRGHFCISDVVIEGKLPEKIKQDAEMYAGCVSGAIQKHKYLEIIKNAGFNEIKVHKDKKIELPNPLLLKYMTLDELRNFKRSKTGIFSITVSANK